VNQAAKPIVIEFASDPKLDANYNHYSLLRLVEDTFGLGNLGQNDTNAAAITGLLK
jgi:hypothetical protein